VHVSSMIFDIFSIIWSICSHTCCHWLYGNFVLCCRIFINWCTLMQNWLIFSGGMGFSIFGLLEFGVGRIFFDMMLLGGMRRFIG
jgi:hypothetical protein